MYAIHGMILITLTQWEMFGIIAWMQITSCMLIKVDVMQIK